MLLLSLPRRIFDNIRHNRCSQIHLPYDGDFRASISAAVSQKYPRLDVCDFPNGVVVNYRVSCRDYDDIDCVIGRCNVSILSDADGGCPDDGLPIAVITFM